MEQKDGKNHNSENYLLRNEMKSDHHQDRRDSNERNATELVFMLLGMFIFFGLHNILQEAIINLPEFKYGIMLGYMEVIGVTLGSFIERVYVAKEKGRKSPLTSYTLLTFCLLSSSALSSMSLNYINFPTKVVFRSCKLLPTMMIATIINQRTFSALEYVLAMAVCLGLIFFTAADWQLAPSFHPIGLILVSMSVVADSILPNAQERLFSHGSSRLEVTLYSNFFTLIVMTLSTFISGDLVGLLKLLSKRDVLCYYAGVYTIISYVAVSFFMAIIKKFGAVTGVLAGTARKGLTLILSFLLFPKKFSWLYVIGSVLVLGGLLLSSLVKIRKKDSKLKIMSKNSEHEMLVKSPV